MSSLHTAVVRVVAAAIMTLALAVGLVVVSSCGSQGGEAATPEGYEELIGAYLRAWEEKDLETFDALVTDAFVVNEISYEVQTSGRVVADRFTQSTVEVLRELQYESLDWDVSQQGELVVTGQGPWFVSVREIWNRTDWSSDGIATYAILEEDGALKIGSHTWVGFKSPDR